MSVFSYAALKAEIEQDPASLGYAALVSAGNDSGLATLLNTPHDAWTRRRPVVPIWRVLAWAAQNGRYARIKAASETTGTDAPTLGLRSAALAALRVFDGLSDFNVDDPVAQAMVQAFVGAGVLAAEDATAFTALGDLPGSNRVQVLWSDRDGVSDSDIAKALRG